MYVIYSDISSQFDLIMKKKLVINLIKDNRIQFTDNEDLVLYCNLIDSLLPVYFILV